MNKINKVIEESREILAEIEHEQWIAWSKNIAETETISPARLERWKTLWCPYSMLTEAQKDQDREWGNKALSTLSKILSAIEEEVEEMRVKDIDICESMNSGETKNKTIHEIKSLLKSAKEIK